MFFRRSFAVIKRQRAFGPLQSVVACRLLISAIGDPLRVASALPSVWLEVARTT